MNKRVLLVVEGPNDEKVMVEKLWDRFDRGVDYKVVTYETNVYVLMRSLFKNGVLDEDLDLLRLLKSEEVPEHKRLGKSERFTDIYLIFDLDPHDPKSDFGMLREMTRFFDDSSSRGKLYINYPMMQSYRHIRGRDDAGFKDRMVQVSLGRKYKSQVDREAWSRLKQINTLNREMLRWIIEQHLSKMNYMIDGSFEMPSFQAYRRMTGEMVLDKQMGMINRHGSLYVLNTSVFLVVDYHPSWFFSDVGPGE